MNKKGFIIESVVITVVLFFFLVFVGIIINGIHHETGHGKQVGYISAVEKTGVFFKTGRAYIKPTLESTQEDIYCIIDQAVYDTLEEASFKGEHIEVSHISWLAPGVKLCEGESAVITSFKPVQ